MKKLIIAFFFLALSLSGICQSQTIDSQDLRSNENITASPIDSVAKHINDEFNNANSQLVKQTDVYSARFLEGYIQALKYIFNLMKQYKLIK